MQVLDAHDVAQVINATKVIFYTITFNHIQFVISRQNVFDISGFSPFYVNVR